jgi:hypothetical protein
MLIKILSNKLLLDRATSQLASCTESSRASSLFSRATKTCSVGLVLSIEPVRAELRTRASSSSSSFFFSPSFDDSHSNTRTVKQVCHTGLSWASSLLAYRPTKCKLHDSLTFSRTYMLKKES